MGKKASVKSLTEWFEKTHRVLPWRDQPTLYRVWISEIMLQQTQVVTVIPYFERFLNRFPTVEILAQASEQEVLLYWAGLGYYSRARNLQRAARQIVSQGAFPQTRDGWLEVPGVGPYTAGAILSIALDQPESILDGNVERVLARVKRVGRQGGDAVYKQNLWKLSGQWVTTAYTHGFRPSVINQALMELGATVCLSRQPLCGVCPLKIRCEARAFDEVALYPPRKKPKDWIEVQEKVHCLVDAQERVLLRRRKKGEWREGLWDFLDEKPRGKIKKVGQIETHHIVTRHKITRMTQVWQWCAAEVDILVDESQRWVSIEKPEVPVGSALKRTMQGIRERFELEISSS
ncbi:A/G-specific adenine glycosylase [Bdellovibrionota bacterium FG-1]